MRSPAMTAVASLNAGRTPILVMKSRRQAMAFTTLTPMVWVKASQPLQPIAKWKPTVVVGPHFLLVTTVTRTSLPLLKTMSSNALQNLQVVSDVFLHPLLPRVGLLPVAVKK